eukprot:scaffold1054_cov116-Isochrysis_galbana.AAC.13
MVRPLSARAAGGPPACPRASSAQSQPAHRPRFPAHAGVPAAHSWLAHNCGSPHPPRAAARPRARRREC